MAMLLIADIQGNLVALEAVVRSPAAQRASAVVCLGDVASGARSAEVIDRLQTLGAIVVRGNMDDVLSRDRPAAPDEDEADPFQEIDAWCAGRLSELQRTWLAERPLGATVELEHGHVLHACHGSPRSNEDAIDPWTPESLVREWLDVVRAKVLAVGHMHNRMLRKVGDRMVVNPGSVGWPTPSTGGLRPTLAEFALVDALPSGVDVSFHHAPYELSELRRDVLESGMPHGSWYVGHWGAT